MQEIRALLKKEINSRTATTDRALSGDETAQFGEHKGVEELFEEDQDEGKTEITRSHHQHRVNQKSKQTLLRRLTERLKTELHQSDSKTEYEGVIWRSSQPHQRLHQGSRSPFRGPKDN